MRNNAFTRPLPESTMLSQFGEFYLHAYHPNSAPSSMSVDFNDSSLGHNGSQAAR